jgi:hypothetical protein
MNIFAQDAPKIIFQQRKARNVKVANKKKFFFFEREI